MGSKSKDKRKIVAIVLILLGLLIIVIITLLVFKKPNKTGNNVTGNVSDGVITNIGNENYTTSAAGLKENKSEKIKEDQIVGDLVISNVKITTDKNGISKLTAEVLNKAKDASGVKLSVVFLGSNSNVIMEKAFEVGDIKENETKNISTEIQGDVSNAASTMFKIAE